MSEDDKPAEKEPGSAAVPDDLLTAEIVGSADSYRRLGEIFVSVLAFLPTAALVTSLIKAPGEEGLDETKLALGLACAVLAVAFGVAVAVAVRAPVELNGKDLEDFDMATLVGSNQRDYSSVLRRIDQVGDSLAGELTAAQRQRDEAQLKALTSTLRRVHLVATARALKKRFSDPRLIALAALALVFAAASVGLLALAPKPKAAEAAAGPTVVKVKLTEKGKQTLGCPTTSFSGLKVGGTDDEPQLVPLRIECTAGDLLNVKVAEKDGLATEVKATDAASEVPK